MTVAGFRIVSSDRAIAWADSEIFAENEPAGHRCKIAVNAMAGVIGAGTGFVALLREAEDALAVSLSFDDAVSRLGEALCRTARDLVICSVAARAEATWQAYFLVGLSHRYGRVVGAVFDGVDGFRAALPAASFTAPHVPESAGDDEQAVIADAGDQLRELRRQNGNASGGVLTVAELGPEGIRCRPAFDLERGVMLRKPREFASGAVRRPVQPAHPDQSQVSDDNGDRRRPWSSLGARPAPIRGAT